MTYPAVVCQVAFSDNPGTAIPSWTDISADLRLAQVRRGRNSEIDQYQAGRATLVFDNRDRAYDPDHTGGDYYPNVKPMRRVRLLAVDNLLTANEASISTDTAGWTGSVYGSGGGATVTLTRQSTYVPSGQSWAIQLAANNGLAGDRGAILTTAEPVTEGQFYYARMDVAAFTSAYSRQATLKITWQNSGGSTVSTTSSSALAVSTSEFQTITVQGTAPSGATQAKLEIVLDGLADAFQYGKAMFTAGIPQEGWRAGGNGYTYPLFDGYVDEWPQQYDPPNDAYVTVRATDAFKVLSNTVLGASAWYYEVFNDGPLHWWRLDDTAGATTALDSVGTADGTASAVTFGVDSIVAYDLDTTAATFTAASGSKITLPASTYIASATDSNFTIEFWAKFTAGGGVTVTFGKVSVIVDATSIEFYGNSNSYGSATFTAIDDDEPHHICCVAEWATGTPPAFGQHNLKVFVDGVSKTVTLASYTASTQGAYIGADWGGEAETTATVDEVVVYDRALSASEVTSHFNAGDLAWAGDTSDGRITRILDALSWPSAARDIGTGTSTIQANSSAINNVLQHFQSVEQTENGALFVTAAGKVKFLGRSDRWSSPYTTSQATFGDDTSTELPYQSIEFDYSDRFVRNDVQGSSQGQTTQRVQDDTSIATYLRRSLRMSGLLSQSNSDVRGLILWLLNLYKDPALRVTSIVVNPLADTDLWAKVLGLELHDRITVKRRPQSVGSAIEQDVFIEAIAHDIAPGRWRTVYQLGVVQPSVWLLGTSGFSELGSTTRLGF